MVPNSETPPEGRPALMAWLRYRLISRGTSYAQIAEGEGVGRNTPYKVFHVHYPRMEQAIADAAGCDRAALAEALRKARADSDRKHSSTLGTKRNRVKRRRASDGNRARGAA